MAYFDPYAMSDLAQSTASTENGSYVGAQTPTLQKTHFGKLPPKTEPYRPASASRLALRPNRIILNKVKHYCTDAEITLNHFFEMAALEYLQNHDPNFQNVGAKAPQIDKIDLKTSINLSSVARIYQFWTGAFNNHSLHYSGKWKPTWTDRDRTLEKELSAIPEAHIELGIIEAIANKKIGSQRINSFQYFRSQIITSHEILATMNEQTVTMRLHWHTFQLANRLKISPPDATTEFLRKNKLIKI